MPTTAGQTDHPLILALPQTPGPLRAADYWKLPGGEPVELIQGHLVQWVSRDYQHQAVVGCLGVRFLEIARKHRSFCVPGPIDVELSEDTILQPDFLYISSSRRDIIEDHITGPPDIAIEVISQSHAARDRDKKLALYAKHGVAEYWIVDPAERVIEFLLLDGDRFKLEPLTSATYTSPRLPEVSIDLPAFWADVERLVNG